MREDFRLRYDEPSEQIQHGVGDAGQHWSHLESGGQWNKHHAKIIEAEQYRKPCMNAKSSCKARNMPKRSTFQQIFLNTEQYAQ